MNDRIKLLVLLAVMVLWTSTPALAEPDLVFVHMMDVHLCDEEFKNSYYGAAKDIDPVATLDQAVEDIMEINPDFVDKYWRSGVKCRQAKFFRLKRTL